MNIFLFHQGKGVEAGPDQVVWRLTCCMGLHRMLPVFTRLKQTQRSNDIPACIEANLLYCHPRQTIKALESRPHSEPPLNKPVHYFPLVIKSPLAPLWSWSSDSQGSPHIRCVLHFCSFSFFPPAFEVAQRSLTLMYIFVLTTMLSGMSMLT